MSNPIPVVLEAGLQDAEITIRLFDRRNELLDDLRSEQLRGSQVMEFSAASTLDVISMSLQTYGPIVGPIAGGAIGARLVPKQAWEAFGNALTAWINRRNDPRVEFDFGDGRRLVVENDPRAVRRALDEVVLPAVREQQLARHERWDRMIGRPQEGQADDGADTDHGAGTP